MDRGRDGDLADRLGELAVADSHTLGAGREVARHRVDAGVETTDPLDQQAVVDPGDELGLVLGAGSQRERLRAHAGAALESGPDGTSGGGGLTAAGRVAVVQEGPELTIVDQRGRAGGEPLAVEYKEDLTFDVKIPVVSVKADPDKAPFEHLM